MKKENQNIEVIARVDKTEKGLSKGLAGVIAIGIMSAPAFAAINTTSDSFGQLLGTFDGWLSGNLGKLLALLGFIGTFIIYLMTHKGSVLFIGIVISLIAGGISGIVDTFFKAGNVAFSSV